MTISIGKLDCRYFFFFKKQGMGNCYIITYTDWLETPCTLLQFEMPKYLYMGT